MDNLGAQIGDRLLCSPGLRNSASRDNVGYRLGQVLPRHDFYPVRSEDVDQVAFRQFLNDATGGV